MVLTGMVEELMNLVDQKFNEHKEANLYAAPANDPYGCADYNPYGQYYYDAN